MKQRKTQARQDGFTLVEILVVIVILGLLATIVAPNLIKFLSASEVDTARLQVLKLNDVVKLYVINEGQVPDSLDVLLEKDDKDQSYLDGYEKIPLDPWQNEYQIIPGDNPRQFEIVCYGPDGDPETEDDISSKTAKSDM